MSITDPPPRLTNPSGAASPAACCRIAAVQFARHACQGSHQGFVCSECLDTPHATHPTPPPLSVSLPSNVLGPRAPPLQTPTPTRLSCLLPRLARTGPDGVGKGAVRWFHQRLVVTVALFHATHARGCVVLVSADVGRDVVPRRCRQGGETGLGSVCSHNNIHAVVPERVEHLVVEWQGGDRLVREQHDTLHPVSVASRR